MVFFQSIDFLVLLDSLFYEKEGFYCQPKDLPSKEFGGVAVGVGHKVRSENPS